MTTLQSPGKDNNYSGTTLSSWSRQQKIAMIAGFVILGFFIAMSACSKQSSKPAMAGISKPEVPVPTASAPAPTTNSATPAAPVAKKKAKKRPAAIVTYRDPSTGVSFRYPRKYELASGEKVPATIDGKGPLPMNFVEAGGVPVVSVALPSGSYPGTDFSGAFFNVNVNRTESEQQCSQFAMVDTRNTDGEALEPERVEIGSATLSKTSDFTGDGMQQTEAQYYHRYEGGACYEFVLGLDTAGFGTDSKIEAVNRDKVFAKLEKILASVKIKPVEAEEAQQIAVQTAAAPEQEAK